MDYPFDPKEIQMSSFELIENHADFIELTQDLSSGEKRVLQRVVHATADFDFIKTMIFHNKALEHGIKALKKGTTIITDVEMVKSGINKGKLNQLGNKAVCFINDADVSDRAKEMKTTRAVIGMRKSSEVSNGAIYVIGNAPTALLEVVHLTSIGMIKPALIIGTPVGFISAKESKATLLILENCPFITVLGLKGGSAVAASIVNSMLHLASDGMEEKECPRETPAREA